MSSRTRLAAPHPSVSVCQLCWRVMVLKVELELLKMLVDSTFPLGMYLVEFA